MKGDENEAEVDVANPKSQRRSKEREGKRKAIKEDKLKKIKVLSIKSGKAGKDREAHADVRYKGLIIRKVTIIRYENGIQVILPNKKKGKRRLMLIEFADQAERSEFEVTVEAAFGAYLERKKFNEILKLGKREEG